MQSGYHRYGTPNMVILVTSATTVSHTYCQVTCARLRSLHFPTSSLPLSAANAYETTGEQNEAVSIVHSLHTCKDQSGFVLCTLHRRGHSPEKVLHGGT